MVSLFRFFQKYFVSVEVEINHYGRAKVSTTKYLRLQRNISIMVGITIEQLEKNSEEYCENNQTFNVQDSEHTEASDNLLSESDRS